MSRVVNVAATVAQVREFCVKHDATITSIEPLRSGGTRVVLSSGDGTAIIRRAYGSKVIDGPVQRELVGLRHYPD